MDTEIQKDEKPIKVIKLDHPFKCGSKQIDEVVFYRRPLAKHMKGLDINNLGVTGNAKILANVTHTEVHEFENMDLDDFNVCANELNSFLPRTLAIGEGQ